MSAAGAAGGGRDLRLVLVRHGQTPSNVDRVLDTRLPGPGLTDLGRAQARALGAELAGELAGAARVAVYSSAARRAQETAALLAAALGLDAEAVDGLHEIQVGDLEGRNDDAAVQRFRDAVTRWQDGDTTATVGGGESADDLVARYGTALAGLRARHADGDVVVVVAHGAAIRLAARALAVGAAADLELPATADDHLDNCGRVTLRAAPGGWEIVAWDGDAPGGAPSARDATTGR